MAREALEGIRVLDISTVIAGPWGAGLLADFGAEVIKVEMPGRGDAFRAMGPLKDGVSIRWPSMGRNKKSVTLDFHFEEGKKLFPFTSGQNQWDFIDYNEFSQQVSAVIEQNEVGGIINICHGRPEKLADRVERFIRENNYNIKLDYGKFPDRPYDSKAVWGDDAKIKIIMENRKSK